MMMRAGLTARAWCRVMTLTLLAMSVQSRSVAQEMVYPVSAALAEDGTLYVADPQFHGIWKIKDGTLTPFFAGTAQFGTPMNAVRSVAIDHQGRLLAGDSATREIYRFDESGVPVPLTQGGVGVPSAIAVRKNGEILVADQEVMYIWKIPAEGGTPVKLAEVAGVVGLSLDDDDQLWVTSRSKNALRRVSPEGSVEIVIAERQMQFPQQIAVDGSKTAYVADNYAKAVWKIVPGQPPQQLAAGAPLINPVGVALDGNRVLVIDPRARAVFEVSAAGVVTPFYPRS